MKYIIEYRNGSFFGRLDENYGCQRAEAKQFSSEKKAKTFMKKHPWILLNGGMAIPAV